MREDEKRYVRTRERMRKTEKEGARGFFYSHVFVFVAAYPKRPAPLLEGIYKGRCPHPFFGAHFCELHHFLLESPFCNAMWITIRGRHLITVNP